MRMETLQGNCPFASSNVMSCQIISILKSLALKSLSEYKRIAKYIKDEQQAALQHRASPVPVFQAVTHQQMSRWCCTLAQAARLGAELQAAGMATCQPGPGPCKPQPSSLLVMRRKTTRGYGTAEVWPRSPSSRHSQVSMLAFQQCFGQGQLLPWRQPQQSFF